MRQFKESQGSLSLTILLVYVYASLTFNNSYNKVCIMSTFPWMLIPETIKQKEQNENNR